MLRCKVPWRDPEHVTSAPLLQGVWWRAGLARDSPTGGFSMPGQGGPAGGPFLLSCWDGQHVPL